MDLKFLKSDELEYELMLRRINALHPNRLALLWRALADEADGAVALPADTERITRQTVQREFTECDAKLVEIVQDIDEMQGTDEALTDGGQSRLIHLAGRVQRLIRMVPDHTAATRLAARICEVGGEAIQARQSFGGTAAFRTEDDFNAISDPTSENTLNGDVAAEPHGGAIPKRLSAGDARSRGAGGNIPASGSGGASFVFTGLDNFGTEKQQQ